MDAQLACFRWDVSSTHRAHVIDRAMSLCSPVISVSDPGNRSILKGLSRVSQMPRQLCDVVLQIKRDLYVFVELSDVKLRLLGSHQLQNATSATCAALCLRDQAHTKDSAQASVNVIKTTHPEASLVFVVAMANDKDHLDFARELFSVGCLEAVVFTEVNIADKSRTASASLLKDSWIQASREKGIDFLHCRTTPHEDQCPSTQRRGRRPILFAEGSLDDSMSFGNRILRAKSCGIIVFTGSLHIVSAVLGHLQGRCI